MRTPAGRIVAEPITTQPTPNGTAGLAEEPAVHRRVAAVLAYLRSTESDADPGADFAGGGR